MTIAFSMVRLESRADSSRVLVGGIPRTKKRLKGLDGVENGKGERAMNEWERERRRMERYKELYPKGTRIMLLNMGGDEKEPIESGARGTVLNVSVGGIDVKWDNGRGLSLIPGQDSFRTLTQSELAQEERMR